jgi:hypothetical protein
LLHLLSAVLHIVAVVGRGAVQNGARYLGASVRVLEDTLGIDEARIVAGIAADEGNGAVGDVCRVVGVCSVEIARYLFSSRTRSA